MGGGGDGAAPYEISIARVAAAAALAAVVVVVYNTPYASAGPAGTSTAATSHVARNSHSFDTPPPPTRTAGPRPPAYDFDGVVARSTAAALTQCDVSSPGGGEPCARRCD